MTAQTWLSCTRPPCRFGERAAHWLREGNQELIAANRLIEILPSLVEAAARGLADSNVTILNGTQGVNEIAAELVGHGLTILKPSRSRRRSPGTGQPPLSTPSGPTGRAQGRCITRARAPRLRLLRTSGC